MKQSRARFKFKFRQCKRDEARVRADILANDLVKRNSTLFWNHVSKQNRRCIIPADTVGGATGHESKSLSADKACGLDNLFAEHRLYASPSIHALLSICFNAFILHGFLPSDLTDIVLVPIVKDKTGDISDKGNYRPIALASVISKVLEMALLVKLEQHFY